MKNIYSVTALLLVRLADGTVDITVERLQQLAGAAGYSSD
jgi:hypothetical protein